MTNNQIMSEIQAVLNELCPGLHMNVERSAVKLTVFLSVGLLLHSFPIEKIEWIKNTSKIARTHLIQHRLLESLQSLQKLFNDEIERIKQWQ